jgi:hypothetical protein
MRPPDDSPIQCTRDKDSASSNAMICVPIVDDLQ